MKFTMQRNRTVTSVLGHSIEFLKGVPTHVPPALHKEVLELGAEPEEELTGDDPRDPKKPVASVEPSDPGERQKQLLDAISLVAVDNVRENFGANGAPHIKALTQLLGWKPSSDERDTAWEKYQLAHKDD